MTTINATNDNTNANAGQNASDTCSCQTDACSANRNQTADTSDANSSVGSGSQSSGKVKLCDGMTKAAKTVADCADRTFKKLQIKCAEARLECCYAALGRKHFDEISASPAPDCKCFVDAINQINGEISALRQALATGSAKQS